MIHFVGAGPGAPDLITIRGQKLLAKADVIIYAGSLVNPALLEVKKPECAVYNSAHMTLEEVLDVMKKAEQSGKTTVRLHTGDPSLYGAIREHMDALKNLVNSGSFSADSKIKSEASGNIRMDVILSADKKFAAVQLFQFVPYTYQPITSVQYFTNEKASAIVAFLSKSKIQ